MSPPNATILGLETSCDETAAAIGRGPDQIASGVVYSQHDVHARFSGVVPELAARRHMETIEVVVAAAMRKAGITWPDLHAVAVTRGPGLAGALLVGVCFGKALAYALRIPLIGVNHLEGHLASAWIDEPDFPTPCVGLVVSGGHTHLYLVAAPGMYQLIGKTLDDAAGEAFDKAATMLGLGFPGGPAIDRIARPGNPQAIRFPRPYLKQGSLDFSFSGLKTALLYFLRDQASAKQPKSVADIAASYQEAIVDVLVEKAFRAVRRYRVGSLSVVGGVSANSRLREALVSRSRSAGIRLALPPTIYCTDNAVMIAAAAQQAYARGEFASWDLETDTELPLPVNVFPQAQKHRAMVAGRR
ncbi:MAG: tRNA (adenosine(37)-N6)-threonylcarbamoyltransferase complex transferase subunit TsaD [Nitrospira sp.]|nr:tRNA (adenosine(37)-N6)-threonylcarbamoyltransferase complex transferase subunit TsaD [Nitrospira sp.]